MPTFESLRNRRPTEKVVVVPGLARIIAGAFGFGGPESQLSSPAQVVGDTKREGGFFHMHEGDLFTPGTGNWILDPTYETPVDTVWGHAFLRPPNVFNPVQPPQVYTYANLVTNGIGGQIAGQIFGQALQEPAPDQGG